MTDPLARLQELGFSEYEARAYIALLQHDSVTGYELAKLAGLPRANVYRVLQKLEERGAAVRMESEDATRYAPLPYEEYLQRVDHEFRHALDATRQALRELAQPVEEAYVWNTRDYPTLLEHARRLIEGAAEQLLIAICPTEAAALAASLHQAEARGVELITLCMNSCPEPCGGCRGDLFRYQVLEPSEPRWLVIVADGEEMLAGESLATGQAQGVRSRQRLLIDLTAWFIRHTIAAAALLLSLNDRLETLLDSDTRETLERLGPEGKPGWLAYMRRLLNTT